MHQFPTGSQLKTGQQRTRNDIKMPADRCNTSCNSRLPMVNSSQLAALILSVLCPVVSNHQVAAHSSSKQQVMFLVTWQGGSTHILYNVTTIRGVSLPAVARSMHACRHTSNNKSKNLGVLLSLFHLGLPKWALMLKPLNVW
jgi:hypothetical protein